MESAKVVLVTNVGGGYGRAVALAYGRSQYHVVCADRDVDLAAKTAAEVEELGGQAIPIQTDMTTQMDVLGAYHKVMEIFGALGGVVHLASQVSTTPFEDLAEGEFLELVAENVRSTYLALKAAARLLPGGWVVVVAPPTLGAVQMHAVRGALREMVHGFRDRFAHPRVNLVLPSRSPSDPRHDQALVRAVRYLGSPDSTGVSGQVLDVELPQPPRIAENLLPEVRAALDLSVRQTEDGWAEWADEEELDDAALVGAPGLRRPGRRRAGGEVRWEDAPSEGYGANGAGRRGADDRLAALGAGAVDLRGAGGSLPEADDDLDDSGDYDDDSELWAADLGLPEGPALRHLVADEEGAGWDQAYASGVEPADELYGDLRRLEGLAVADGDGPASRDDGAWPPGPRRQP